MKKIILMVMILILGGCAHRNPLSDMQFQTVNVPPYVVAGWYKIQAVGEPVKIYIEGDGSAFDDQGHPTDNPTPKGTFMRELAAGDPSPNVVYLGRVCQYLKTGACKQADWTTGRFAAPIIDSMDRAVVGFMKKARANQVVLIGFSGGAQVSGLIAARRPEQVKKWITIGGVLDQRAWTAYHGDQPLTESLNLADQAEKVRAIPQIHYVGGRDDVVPAELVERFAGADRVVVVPRGGHGVGLASVYDEIYEVR